MTIEIFRLRDNLPAQAIEPLPSDRLQTVVSCQGDIAVLTYGPDENTHGVAWLVLEEGPIGEPGRETMKEECPEKMEPRMLQDIPGVLIGAKDWKSLDALIKSLTELRDKLRGPVNEEAELAALRQIGREMVEEVHAETERCLLDALRSPDPLNSVFDIASEIAARRENSDDE
jgi:hypothetical protein